MKLNSADCPCGWSTVGPEDAMSLLVAHAEAKTCTIASTQLLLGVIYVNLMERQDGGTHARWSYPPYPPRPPIRERLT